MNLPPIPEVPPTTKFKRGDVVRLNSAEIYLTVAYVSEDLVKCMWFDSNTQVAVGEFHEDCLTLVPAPGSTIGADAPTPPAGYELKLGKNLSSLPVGYLEW